MLRSFYEVYNEVGDGLIDFGRKPEFEDLYAIIKEKYQRKSAAE